MILSNSCREYNTELCMGQWFIQLMGHTGRETGKEAGRRHWGERMIQQAELGTW